MIPLAIPNISGNEGKYLQECVDNNFVSSVGPFVDRFEDDVAKASGAQHAVATASGTSGLLLALIAVGVRRDDLVILPSYTFIASANAIAHSGAMPWLFDVEARSWTLDPAQVKECLASQTERREGELIHRESGRRVGAIMPVYTFGTPADMEAFQIIAKEFQLPLVADAAAALGASYQKQNLGEQADLTVFSFNGNKTITCGGGGMVVGGQEHLLKRIRHLSTQARLGPDYDHDEVGFNYRMTNLQAAVGCAQLERLDEFVSAKRSIANKYNQAFMGIPGAGIFPEVSYAESACWFSGITINKPILKGVNSLCQQMRENGIGGRTFWKPVHLQAPYSESPYTSFDVTESFWSSILTLPCSTSLTDDDQRKVIDVVSRLLKN
jgi:aminotransferase in exopolysaccharide biosynthesis